MSAYGNAMGFEVLTVSSAVKLLTTTVYATTTNYGAYDNSTSTSTTVHQTFASRGESVKASVALITVDGVTGDDDVRYTLNGVTPTASTGHLIPAGQGTVIYGYGNIAGFKAIRTSTDTTIQVTYFRS